jgi:small subunit ribosomal protein S21
MIWCESDGLAVPLVPLTGPPLCCTHWRFMEALFGKPVEVEVRDSLEKAMKILKQKMSKEGILQELKRRRFYEKPSVKRKRKTREARKRLRREMKRRFPR